ncbi:MAG TPA: DUF1275 domain-containing protein [Enteractinococcus helveticum]|uniref:DUF1275 domain-containing protein n=1 Tax=Enteractinococcus helveticum TaxID=1837282 RepID=A0A921K6L3_9MICC|nr:YoaK family protein [Enteractinococcus helveticum]HJF13552.1 DUF1275 domain-containing protein [Enteractinococcus helveticum]
MAASLSTRQQLLAVGLTANAGFVDGLFFIHLGGYFVSFMSGNSTRAAAALAEGHVDEWFVATLLIFCFVVGVMLSSFAVRFGPKRFHPPAESLLSQQVTPHGSAVWTAFLLMMLGGITASIPVLSPYAPFVIASATGAVNGTFTRRGEVTVGLTYMTGTLVKMGQSLASAIALRSSVYLFRFVRYLFLWSAIAVGALLGAWAYVVMGLSSVWLAVVAMTVLAIMLTWRVQRRHERRVRRPQATKKS